MLLCVSGWLCDVKPQSQNLSKERCDVIVIMTEEFKDTLRGRGSVFLAGECYKSHSIEATCFIACLWFMLSALSVQSQSLLGFMD